MTLGVSEVNSGDGAAGLVEKCAVPWRGDGQSATLGGVFGEWAVLGVEDLWAGLVAGLVLRRLGSVFGGFCGDTEMGTRLGLVSVFPPTESRRRERVRGGLKLVFSKVLVSVECSVASGCLITRFVSGLGEVLATVSSFAASLRSIRMATEEPRRAAAALIVSTATGSRARGVASLGVEAWLVSVS